MSAFPEHPPQVIASGNIKIQQRQISLQAMLPRETESWSVLPSDI